MRELHIKELKFARVADVKVPNRAHKQDAGLDLFVPNDFKPVILKLGDSILIPSGIKFEIPDNYMLKIFNKSGVASKKGLIVGAEVCDSRYSGVVHVNLHKVSGEPVTINPGDKIAQAILIPIETPDVVEVSESELYGGITTERAAGGFGSTGDK